MQTRINAYLSALRDSGRINMFGATCTFKTDSV